MQLPFYSWLQAHLAQNRYDALLPLGGDLGSIPAMSIALLTKYIDDSAMLKTGHKAIIDYQNYVAYINAKDNDNESI